jgi:bifunctional non-homologous end joining protein LigD
MRVEIDGQAIDVSNPDKVLLPDGITKRDLVEHYRRVAPVMVPHIAGRLLTVQRFPDGLDDGGFYQKDTPDHYPDWIERCTVPKEDGEVAHTVVRDGATLVYLANLAAITLHVGQQTVDHLDRPDRMVFDLDPPEGDDPAPVRFAARAVRDLLGEAGLESRLMTTGSKGYHVVVPVRPERGFGEVKALARGAAELVADRHPGRLTVEQRIARRAGRVFVDFLRNAASQTAVAPYSVRARPSGPVAAPIDWDELGSIAPADVTMANVFRRLGQKDDPWAVDGIGPQSIDGLEALLAEG